MRIPPDIQLNIRLKGAEVSTKKASSKCMFHIRPALASAHLCGTAHLSLQRGEQEWNKLQKAANVGAIQGLRTALPAKVVGRINCGELCPVRPHSRLFPLQASALCRTLTSPEHP
jgi:hypothetical protein